MCQRRFNRNICRRAFTIALCLAGASWASGTWATAQQLSIRHYDVSNGLAHSHISAIHQDAKGYLWLATWEGLSRFDGYRFSNYDQRDSLGDPIINAITEDRMGHRWVGTNGGGACKLSGKLIQTFTKTKGLPDQDVGKSFRMRRGIYMRAFAAPASSESQKEKPFLFLDHKHCR